MAKFCKYCGTPLEDGQVCSCPQAQAEFAAAQQAQPGYQQAQPGYQQAQPGYQQPQPGYQQAQPGYQQAQPGYQQAQPGYQQGAAAQQAARAYVEQGGQMTKEAFGALLQVLQAPATGARRFVAIGQRNMALVLMGFQALLCSIYVMFICNSYNSLVKSGASAYGALYGSLYDSAYGSMVNESALKPYLISMGKAFFVTLVVSMLLSVALAGLLFGMVKLMHGTMNFDRMLCVAALRSVAVLPVMLVALILFFVNPPVSICVFFLGNLLACFFMREGLGEAQELHQDRLPYMLFGTMVVFMLLSVFVMTKVVGMYVPADIMQAIQEGIEKLNVLRNLL